MESLKLHDLHFVAHTCPCISSSPAQRKYCANLTQLFPSPFMVHVLRTPCCWGRQDGRGRSYGLPDCPPPPCHHFPGKRSTASKHTYVPLTHSESCLTPCCCGAPDTLCSPHHECHTGTWWQGPGRCYHLCSTHAPVSLPTSLTKHSAKTKSIKNFNLHHF